jgi:hypothetical protein
MKSDSDSATAMPTLETISTVELTIERNPEITYGTSGKPRLFIPRRTVNLSATVDYDSSDQGWDWLDAGLGITGAGLTGEPTQNFVKGGIDVTSGRHPSDATRFLRFVSDGTPIAAPVAEANWQFGAARPDTDPGGGRVQFDLAGPLFPLTSASHETIVQVRNDVASTY